MRISFKCPFCGTTGKAPEQYSGQRIPCPDCRQPIDLPGVATLPPPPPPIAPTPTQGTGFEAIEKRLAKIEADMQVSRYRIGCLVWIGITIIMIVLWMWVTAEGLVIRRLG